MTSKVLDAKLIAALLSKIEHLKVALFYQNETINKLRESTVNLNELLTSEQKIIDDLHSIITGKLDC